MTAAARRCEALLANVAQGPADEANVLVFLGGLQAMHGRLDEGRALVAKARAGQSYVVTTGTGSGKSLCFFVPVVDAIVRARKAGRPRKTRAISFTSGRS